MTGSMSPTVISMEIRSAALTPCRARGTSFTPRFWPTKVVAPMDTLCMGRNRKASILVYAVQPPMQSAPK